MPLSEDSLSFLWPPRFLFEELSMYNWKAAQDLDVDRRTSFGFRPSWRDGTPSTSFFYGSYFNWGDHKIAR